MAAHLGWCCCYCCCCCCCCCLLHTSLLLAGAEKWEEVLKKLCDQYADKGQANLAAMLSLLLHDPLRAVEYYRCAYWQNTRASVRADTSIQNYSLATDTCAMLGRRCTCCSSNPCCFSHMYCELGDAHTTFPVLDSSCWVVLSGCYLSHGLLHCLQVCRLPKGGPGACLCAAAA
jgi:hypothetical protein